MVSALRGARAVVRHRAAVSVEPVGQRLGQRLLRRRRAGRRAGSDGVAVRLQRRRQLDHRRQNPGRTVGDRRLGAAVRAQLLESAGAAGPRRGRRGRGAVRGGAPGCRTPRRAARRDHPGADPGGRVDVPVQQSRRAAGAAAGGGGLLCAACAGGRRQPLVATAGRRRGRVRVFSQDAAGVLGAAGVRPGVPVSRRCAAAGPAATAARLHAELAGVGGMVSGVGRSLAGHLPALYRWFAT